MKNLLLALIIFTFVCFFSADKVAAQNAALRNLSGETVSLQDQKGKVVVLAVGASWLPLSKDQAVIINKLAKNYAKKDVVVYFIATDSALPKSRNYATDAQIAEFGTKNKIAVTILRDTENILMKKYSLDQIPAFVILDKTGKVADTISGLDPEADLAAQISETVNKIL